MNRLDELKPGQMACIQSIDADASIKKRLMELGIRKDLKVFMRRNAPMGDPMEISVMGSNISIRKSAASHVLIILIEDKDASC